MSALSEFRSTASMRSREHPRIITQGLEFAYVNSLVVGMRRIDQAVVLRRGENRWRQQQTIFSPFGEFIPEVRQLGRGCGISPIRGQVADSNPFAAQLVRDFRYG